MINKIISRTMLSGHIIIGITGSEHPTINGKSVHVGDKMTTEEIGTLRHEFEPTKTESLEYEISELQMKIRLLEQEIQSEIETWNRLYAASTDSDWARETGLWAIDCPNKKMTGAVKFHFASEHDEIEMENGELIPLENRFTEREIESLTMVI